MDIFSGFGHFSVRTRTETAGYVSFRFSVTKISHAESLYFTDLAFQAISGLIVSTHVQKNSIARPI